ncbi:protein kinase [Pyxidicoccus parkwayensis]|uniref:Protein kinase n=1 Tax=Pyxidicoccus parkwayensis TaxID=2813578 RepID=A0ABX7NY80_9BACT|nr:serine/threonine-protein kinase [Pyxidicoccus parkwaysis]QSQ23349.1 protein kinase [Pyxidicoccus parkwaysis]
MTRPSDGDLRTDTVLRNTYKIASVLGRGGMGSVYLAQHLRLPGKQVAVKVLRGGEHLTQEIFTRFRREAEIASRLGHPNIVEVLDYDTLEDGTPFLVLEFLRGESLQSRLERGRIPLDEVFSYTRQMGSALQAAHGAGIVHRDLKPANVFLVPTDSGGVVGQRLKLLDFGISKVLTSETLQTQEATLIGTPQYMSPEQAMGKNREIDARTDIFALGCIVYEMMSGKPVFGAGTLAQMIFRVVYEPAEPLGPLCPEAPASAVSAVHRALSKSADERYPDVASFVEALTGSPLHTLSPPSGAQPLPRTPKAPSGIALPSQDAPKAPSGIALPTQQDAAEAFEATVAPGSVRVAPDATGRMGVVEMTPGGSGTGRFGVQPASGGPSTGRMGMVQPEPSGMARMDPPALEPTLISKQTDGVIPRAPQPVTAMTPPSQPVPQPLPFSIAPGSQQPGVATPASQSGAMAAAQPVAAPVSQPVSMPVAAAQPVGVPVAPQPAAKGRAPLIAAAVALFVAGGGVVWWMGHSGTSTPAPNTNPQATVQQPATGTNTGTQQPATGIQQVAAVQQPATGTQPQTAAPNGTEPGTPPQTATPNGTEPGTTATPPTVANTPPDKTPERPVGRPETKEVLPEEVAQLLAEGEKALASGDGKAAVDIARKSLRVKKTAAAYSLTTRGFCQMGDLGGARGELAKVARSDRARVLKYCQQHETDLSP